MSSPQILNLHDSDNIAVALRPIESGETLAPTGLVAKENVPSGHKISLGPIRIGQEVTKYGRIIGVATQDIQTGEHVHVHNVAMTSFHRNEDYGRNAQATDILPLSERATFDGYRRADGAVGTRNYVGIVTSVNCSASAAKLLAREAERSGLLDRYPGVDGIVPIVHGAGCCIGTDDEAFRKLQRAIWGYATHPNFASVLMLGLGCEANQIPLMLEAYGRPVDESFQYYTLQSAGGTRKSIEKGLVWLEAALEEAAKLGVLHHDIAPHNVFVNGQTVTVANFVTPLPAAAEVARATAGISVPIAAPPPIEIPSPSTLPLKKFMAGLPMKLATNRFCGVS